METSSTQLRLRSERFDRKRFRLLQITRWLLGAIITLFLARAVDFAVREVFLVIAMTAGVFHAGRLVQKARPFYLIFGGAAAIALFASLFFSAANSIIATEMGSISKTDFLIDRYSNDFFLLYWFYLVALFSTYFFWTNKNAVTVEGAISSVFFVWLLSGHRNYHVDAPKEISSLVWKSDLLQRFQLEPQHLFLALSALFVIVMSLYFILSSERPVFGKEPEIKAFGPTQKVLATTFSLLLLLALGYYAIVLNSKYVQDISRVSNGVGENDLSFHSAIAPTQQPAALVRFEGDYSKNPWAPMIYFREGALSEYSGYKIEWSPSSYYDRDTPRIVPGEGYRTAQQDEELNESRVQLIHSVYLLTKHKTPIAIDFPQQIAPIRNPYPEKFRLAYQAVSMAPVAKLQDLIGLEVGDPSWSSEEWEHYLRAPGSKSTKDKAELPNSNPGEQPMLDSNGEDLRYLQLARQLTSSTSDKIIQAAMISDYLSRNSIYTRNPEHKVEDKADPVAPYLFAKKKRGYCVHFAHAAVYMMRLLGIPARIGTGYLADLSYAKDGHILLQMGDRHVWPEVYVRGRGWMVFDITPAKAEGEQTLVPDESLLEELMSKLDPVQALIDVPPVTVEEPRKIPLLSEIVSKTGVVVALCLALLSWMLIKAWLRFGYLVVPQNRRVAHAYSSFVSVMEDLRVYRRQGETRREYCLRLEEAFGVDASLITRFSELDRYALVATPPSKKEISKALSLVNVSWDRMNSKIKRICAFLLPFSLRKR